MSDFTTYPTPYDRAVSLLDDLVSFATTKSVALPTTRYAQVGDIVRDCESVIVSVGSLTPDPNYDPVTCIYPRTATFLVEIIRKCAVVFSQQGMTIPSAISGVSDSTARDGQLLYDFAADIDGWSSKQPWSVIWSLAESGLSVASLQIAIGIP